MARRPSWWLGFLRIVWPLTTLSARMTRLPVIGPLFARLVRPLFTGKNFNVTYLPVNREVRGAGSAFIPEKVLEELIRRSSHRITINRCTCRETWKCADYPVEVACMHLGEGTRHVPSSVATPRTIDEALAHMRRMIGLGLTPMVGRVRMDDFFYGTPNTGRSLTVCFCCPCCCTIYRSSRYFPSEVRDSLVRLYGLTVVTDTAKCTACGACVDSCFIGARTIRDGSLRYDAALCKGCGRCATVCPSRAVTVAVDDVDDAIGEIMGRIGERVAVD